MSYLLRKSRTNNGVSSTIPRGSGSSFLRNPLARSRPYGGGGGAKSHAHASMVNTGGGQVQLQRVIPGCPTTLQMNSMTQQKAIQRPLQQQQRKRPVQQKEQAQQGVISMEEVMADLRVLEQQQREAQRSLAQVKLVKAQKLEQRNALESRLASLKYLNGERHAQLLRAREVLSKSTRELGSVRLRSGRTGDDIKNFDETLKKALAIARLNQVARRRIDADILELKNSEALLERRVKTAADKLKKSEAERDEARRNLEALMKSTQEKKVEAKSLAEDATLVRAEVSGLEEDLGTAQQMEASTKFRVSGIAVDIESETKRHKEAMEALQAKIASCTIRRDASKQKFHKYQTDIEESRGHIHDAWKSCVELQEKAGHDVSLEPVDGLPVPSLDVSRFQIDLKEKEACIAKMAREQSTLRESISQLQEKCAQYESEKESVLEKTETIQKDMEVVKKSENERVSSREKLIEELNAERDTVTALRQTADDLKASVEEANNNSNEAEAEAKARLEDTNEQLEDLRVKLDGKRLLLKEKIQTIKVEQVERKKLEEAARKRVEIIQTTFEDSRQESEALEQLLASLTRNAVDDISQRMKALEDETEKQAAVLLKKYPLLESLRFSLKEGVSIDSQVHQAVSSITAACEKRIAKAEAQLRERERVAREKQMERRAAERAERERREVEREEEERRRREAERAEKERQRREAEREEEERTEKESQRRGAEREEDERRRREEEERADEERKRREAEREEEERRRKEREWTEKERKRREEERDEKERKRRQAVRLEKEFRKAEREKKERERREAKKEDQTRKRRQTEREDQEREADRLVLEQEDEAASIPSARSRERQSRVERTEVSRERTAGTSFVDQNDRGGHDQTDYVPVVQNVFPRKNNSEADNEVLIQFRSDSSRSVRVRWDKDDYGDVDLMAQDSSDYEPRAAPMKSALRRSQKGIDSKRRADEDMAEFEKMMRGLQQENTKAIAESFNQKRKSPSTNLGRKRRHIEVVTSESEHLLNEKEMPDELKESIHESRSGRGQKREEERSMARSHSNIKRKPSYSSRKDRDIQRETSLVRPPTKTSDNEAVPGRDEQSHDKRRSSSTTRKYSTRAKVRPIAGRGHLGSSEAPTHGNKKISKQTQDDGDSSRTLERWKATEQPVERGKEQKMSQVPSRKAIGESKRSVSPKSAVNDRDTKMPKSTSRTATDNPERRRKRSLERKALLFQASGISSMERAPKASQGAGTKARRRKKKDGSAKGKHTMGIMDDGGDVAFNFCSN